MVLYFVTSKTLSSAFLQSIFAVLLISHLSIFAHHQPVLNNACKQIPSATSRFGTLWLVGKAFGCFGTYISILQYIQGIPDIEMADLLKLARSGKDTKDENRKISPTTPFSVYGTGRFYEALTAYWVASESRKFAKQCRYQLQSTGLEIYEKLAAIWHQGADLQENLDTLGLYDFVYGFFCLYIDGADFDSFPC